MAVTNQMLMKEIQRLQATVVSFGERMAGLEAWRSSHEKNEHLHLRQQIAAGQRTQERQGDRLWKVALQVANLAALVAAITKMAGAW